MTDIFVQRGAGDRVGDEIVDPLLTDINVAIQRGRNEIDDQASGIIPVEVDAVHRTGVRAGQLAEFVDRPTGASWKGKITGVSHSVRKVKAEGPIEITTTLQIDRPTENL